VARPTKLTLDVQTTLVFALSEGATIEHACDYAGINPDTFYAWMQRGAAGEAAFAEFSESVTRARGRGVVTDLSTISKAVLAGDWKAAAWRLQHRYPTEYGAKLKIQGDADHPLRVLHEMPDADLDALITRRLREAGYDGGHAALPEGAAPGNESSLGGLSVGGSPDPEHREGVPL
jgi:transposase